MLLLLARPEAAKGRYPPLLRLPPLRGECVISNFTPSLFFLIYRAFLQVTLYTCLLISLILSLFFFFGSLSTRRILLLPAPYCLMSPRWRYVFLFCHLHVFSLPYVIMCPVSLSLSLLFFLCIYIYICVCISTYHAFFSLLFYVLQAKPELISIYHPIAEEVSTAMGTSYYFYYSC